jgi:hypothetical protein
MRARIAQLATPRKLVAAECCTAIAIAGAGMLVVGATPLAAALIGVCAVTMAPALVVVTHLERRGSSD